MLDLTFEKLVLIAIITSFLIRPHRLPVVAEQLAALIKRAKLFTHESKKRMQDEMGPGFDDFDWKRLDPRQYDPRKIIRDALLDANIHVEPGGG